MLDFTEGIQRSLANSVLLALISSILIGVIGILISWLIFELIYGLRNGLSYGLHNGLIIAVSGGLLVCASRGGLAVLRHYVIRLLLARSHVFPWQAVRFLDDATTRIFLRRVGGGYSFTHLLLLDYFAELDAAEASAESEQTPVANTTLPSSNDAPAAR